ncbi:MAG: PilZ domain-containing protein [Anaerolineae bacterium]|nr:PilZ domain-containing protein [Anaerolineae bacterium]
MSKHGNRRKEARELVVEFTLVYDSKKGKLLGYLRDLTMNGAQINGSKKLEEGTIVSLSIELPNDLPGVRAKELRVSAKVSRCIMVNENPPGYAIGFEFTDINSEESEVLEKLLKRYYFLRPWAH